MKAVGVKLLKAKLSEYLRLVKAGETVLVLERDELVAELIPPRHTRPLADSLDQMTDQLADRGDLQLRTKDSSDWSSWLKPSASPTISSRQILDSIRKER